MNRDLVDKLYVPFKLKQRKGVGGMTFDFIPTEDVINRMNMVFDGNWSTKIITQDVIEDFVLIRVQVEVVNGTGVAISHEGYGSAQTQRYTSGTNKGKLLDIGNAYKSAESKAIKNACTRFGVGLYFKEKDIPNTVIDPPVRAKTVIEKVLDALPVPEPSPRPVPQPVAPEPAPRPVPQPVEAVKQVVIPEPVFNVPPFEAPPVEVPPVTTKPVVESPTLPNLPPFSAGNVAKETLNEAPFNTSTPKNSGVSDVQMAALNGILAIKKIPLNELLTNAFESSNIPTGSIPDSIDGLSYSQAVAVIKYGNGIYRKS